MDSNRDDTSNRDKRIIKIAREISSAADTVIPRLLLQLQGVLDSSAENDDILTSVKNQIWKYELYTVMLTSLKQDFNKILNGWNTAVKVSQILISCCNGWSPPEQEAKQTFLETFVPETLNVFLSLTNRLQKKYSKVSLVLEDTRKQLLANFYDMLECVTMFCYRYNNLFKHALESVFFLQMLLTDDVQTGLRIMNFIQSAHRHKQGLFPSLDAKIGNQILDELTYKLSIGQNTESASAAICTLIVLCESYPPLVEILCSRYKGLRLLLLSRQTGLNKISNIDAQRLLLLLNTGNFQQAELEKVAKAARLIQAWWKSYSTRRQIKNAGVAIGRLQRSFRFRKQRAEQQRQEEKMRADLEHMLIVQRRYTMRQLHRRQLYALEIVPASEIEKHLANEQHRAAIRIQASWKGFRVRHGLDQKRDNIRRYRAAVKIQRLVRKWLEKIHAKKEQPVSWHRPLGLTEDRRVELQSKIQDWREVHRVEPRCREMQEELHYRAQDLLKSHVVATRAAEKRRLHREAQMARIDMDATLLLNTPRLCDIGDDISDILQSFVCHSAPVAARARLDHTAELRLLEQPWWQKIGDEYQDAKNYVEEDEKDDWKVF